MTWESPCQVVTATCRQSISNDPSRSALTEIRVFTNDVGLGCDRGHAVAFPHGTKHQVGQSANQEWRIVQSGHHKKLTDPRRLCLFPCLDVVLWRGFIVLGKKQN